MNNTTVGVFKAFLTEHTEQAKKVIRDYRLKNKPETTFAANKSLLLALFDGNKESYRTVKCDRGDTFQLRSLYIGKKGDVIFVFYSPRFSINSADRIEMKLEMALLELSSFVEHIHHLFEEAMEERLKWYRQQEIDKELKEKEAQRLAKQAEIEAKAEKYRGKVKYGAW